MDFFAEHVKSALRQDSDVRPRLLPAGGREGQPDLLERDHRAVPRVTVLGNDADAAKAGQRVNSTAGPVRRFILER